MWKTSSPIYVEHQQSHLCGTPAVPFICNNSSPIYVEQQQSHLQLSLFIYRVSREECARLREGVPYVEVYRYNPKHLCPKLNGYGDNGHRSLKLWQLLHTY